MHFALFFLVRKKCTTESKTPNLQKKAQAKPFNFLKGGTQLFKPYTKML